MLEKMNKLSGEQLCQAAEQAMADYSGLYPLPENCADYCFDLIAELIKRNEPQFKEYSIMLTNMIESKF